MKLISALVAAAALTGTAYAQSLDDAYDVRILPGWRAPDGTHMAGVEVTLAEGWKTYWRAPGDAGIPPQFDWRASRNLDGVEIGWPTPKTMDQGGARTIGYANRVIFPIKVAPKRAGKPVRLSARIDLGVCKDVCLPVTVELTEDLLPGATQPNPRIAAAVADRPYSAEEAGVARVSCQITPSGDGLTLRAELDMPTTGGDEMVVIESDNPQVWIAPTQARREGGRLVAETQLYHASGKAFALNRSGLRLTVLGGSHAVDIQGCPAD